LSATRPEIHETLKRKQRILFLIADTGGGHRACALSLKTEIERRYGDRFETIIYNLYQQTRIGRLFQRLYRSIANRRSFFFIAVFYLCCNRPALFALESLLGRVARTKLVKVIQEIAPVLVVSVHPTINGITARSLQRAGSEAKSAIVITDLANIHVSWYYRRDFDLHITCSQEMKRRDVALGMDPEKVRVLPLAIDPKFNGPPPGEEIAELKRRLMIPTGRTVVLFAGGGEGFRRLGRFLARTLESSILMKHCFFLVVTGNNREQKDEAERIVRHRSNFMICGFTKIMYELTCVSDIVATKAGPATVMQALVLEKPLLLTWYVRPHERANVKMVVNSGYGRYTPTPKGLVRELESLILSESKLEGIKRKLESASFRNGSEQVARTLIGLMSSPVYGTTTENRHPPARTL